MPVRAAMKTIDVTRDKRFWLVASAMVVGQLLAFWLLCSYQVQRAQVREAALQMERNAVADCLRSNPGASRSRCAAGIAPSERDTQAVALEGSGAALSRAGAVNSVWARP